MPQGREVAVIEFGVDEIRQAPEEQPDRGYHRNTVADRQDMHACLRAKSHIATATPPRPPWKDMPPCHTMRFQVGWRRKRPDCKGDIAKPAAEYDADDDMVEKAVDGFRRQWCGGPFASRLRSSSRQARRLGQRIPSDTETPKLITNGSNSGRMMPPVMDQVSVVVIGTGAAAIRGPAPWAYNIAIPRRGIGNITGNP